MGTAMRAPQINPGSGQQSGMKAFTPPPPSRFGMTPWRLAIDAVKSQVPAPVPLPQAVDPTRNVQPISGGAAGRIYAQALSNRNFGA